MCVAVNKALATSKLSHFNRQSDTLLQKRTSGSFWHPPHHPSPLCFFFFFFFFFGSGIGFSDFGTGGVVLALDHVSEKRPKKMKRRREGDET